MVYKGCIHLCADRRKITFCFGENRHFQVGVDNRVRTITATLEAADSSIGEFRDDTVRQLVSSIRVLDRERLSIRFKDGTEIEQIIECVGRVSA